MSKPAGKPDKPLPPLAQSVKIGRSTYVIQQHFAVDRTVTDAIYELLRVEQSLDPPKTPEKTG